MKRICATALAVVLVLSGAWAAWAAPPAKKDAPAAPAAAKGAKITPPAGVAGMVKSDTPITIASDQMEVYQAERKVVFNGHVTAQQGDLTITGKTLTVYAAEGAKPSADAMMAQLDRIEVQGDVVISQKEKVATADKAVYYSKEQKIVLLGDPRVAQGKDSVAGKVITLYLAEERSVVEGSRETPVQAVFHPSSKPPPAN